MVLLLCGVTWLAVVPCLCTVSVRAMTGMVLAV
jgi:hypothetical protein